MNYSEYYENQLGEGGIGRVYVGAANQRGSGIGSFLRGVFRYVLPYVRKGASVVGKEALRAGMNIVNDVTENNTSFRDSFNHHVLESGKNLKRKMQENLDTLTGLIYKLPRLALSKHKVGSPYRSNIARKKKKRVQKKSIK